jgi:hypothetical protein
LSVKISISELREKIYNLERECGKEEVRAAVKMLHDYDNILQKYKNLSIQESI